MQNIAAQTPDVASDALPISIGQSAAQQDAASSTFKDNLAWAEKQTAKPQKSTRETGKQVAPAQQKSNQTDAAPSNQKPSGSAGDADAAPANQEQSRSADDADAGASLKDDADGFPTAHSKAAKSSSDSLRSKQSASQPDSKQIDSEQKTNHSQDTIDAILANEETDVDWVSFVASVNAQLKPETKAKQSESGAEKKLALDGAEQTDDLLAAELIEDTAPPPSDDVIEERVVKTPNKELHRLLPELPVQSLKGGDDSSADPIPPKEAFYIRPVEPVAVDAAVGLDQDESMAQSVSVKSIVGEPVKQVNVKESPNVNLAENAKNTLQSKIKAPPSLDVVDPVAQATTEVFDAAEVVASLAETESLPLNKSTLAQAIAAKTSVKKAPLSKEYAVKNEVDSALQGQSTADELISRDVVIDSLKAVLPDIPRANMDVFTSQLRSLLKTADTNLASAPKAGTQNNTDLKVLVDQALVVADIALTPEQMVQLDKQLVQNDQLVFNSPLLSDTPRAITAADRPMTANTSTLTDGPRISVDGVSVDSATQTAEQKVTSQASSQLDKAIAIQNPEGQKQMAEKIRWMVNARVSSAEIRLDPPELGSMQIRVNVAGDVASVNFVVQSAQARDLLMDAAPRLRDMMSEQGMDLGESFVQHQDRHNDQQSQFEEGEQASQGFSDQPDEDTVIMEQPLRSRQSANGIDAYV